MAVRGRMKVGFLASLLILAACGEEPATVPVTEQPPIGGEGRPRSLAEAVNGQSAVPLWQVSDEDTVLTIVGTIQFVPPGTAWQTPSLKSALAQADGLILEADILSPDAVRAANLAVTNSASAPAGQELSSFFSESQRREINERLARFDTNLTEIDSYRPWFASMQVSLLALIMGGGDPASGTDVALAREAEARSLPVRYLETASEQIALLADGEDAREAAYFYDLLGDLDNPEAYYADLLAAWYEGDVRRLDFLRNERLAGHADRRGRFLLDRNRRWAETLAELLAEEPGEFVVAVNIAHLVGLGSLPTRLEELGYEAERVDTP
ncbi:MAG: TraB/GumN family protein [Parvularcula sp.]|jgi:uncharacterized protein YbaP (TraB family)|nr:TraB/GumN family protein [Parvularcula sp.]